MVRHLIASVHVGKNMLKRFIYLKGKKSKIIYEKVYLNRKNVTYIN